MAGRAVQSVPSQPLLLILCVIVSIRLVADKNVDTHTRLLFVPNCSTSA
jgi:hypothetical protein